MHRFRIPMGRILNLCLSRNKEIKAYHFIGEGVSFDNLSKPNKMRIILNKKRTMHICSGFVHFG